MPALQQALQVKAPFSTCLAGGGRCVRLPASPLSFRYLPRQSSSPNIPVQKGIGRSSSVAPKRLEDMSQRFSPDRRSVAHTLSALFRRMGRRNLRVRARDWNDPETLRRLTQIQETKREGINSDIVMDRVVKLARKELGADGTGVWLFTGNEIFFGSGAGQASNDERLRLACSRRC